VNALIQQMTPHYSRIWQTVQQIPLGAVASYGQIADLAGLPGRARLVGKALRLSPTPLPWHRVVRSNLTLAFAPGSAEAAEQSALLRQEGILLRANRIPKQYQWQPNLAELLFNLQF
jgi:methylated-DNA-protein-cysteine methyltransferase-like protein